MKSPIKLMIKIYQILFILKPASCRYSPTCSAYMVNAIDKYGLIKGFLLGAKRVLSCQPLSKRPYYDPI
ncbi:membrane protein insertion efficiency factor YidD [Candidatus Curtissbacteria bacterium RBG_13_35_7]|uniref:Membrane protein insertion efficiency factor YidD n=1 Tax=Candidatus Curtissbacteria bacterium RBG_13_35_7 TaxID=1797705 RepID=A0A1F5G103_9BACT|nr:MAG: membrane protein insertion efficiency factor YidD [Candidatus Curtissbacteria bacterium RBG_13_35_7]